ncbi:MarR family winged helix-turn-helix transcriptional regulator [Devosia ginsengisoli]|uniref:MarR family winged helix-turn-helix transcriptional regulator n=1 Tax=Devosia ginsengisoli TaxID=400770 RepID=UPI0026EE8D6C|nr:MarR family transcriptional regulator [Devosia ginsengisoli]MCR6671170.1 MarR family transcriptional regulator [Devosia ginsengisoli]
MVLTRETSAGYMANWAARLFSRELERQLAPTGIAPAYMPVLFALADGGTLTQKELTRRAAVEQPTMAATLKRMERDGMIHRRQDPGDKRSALVALTPLALGKVETVERVVTAINALALEQLDVGERRQFLSLLGRVIAVLEAQDADLGS